MTKEIQKKEMPIMEEGYSWVSPTVVISNPDETFEFYEKGLGLVMDYKHVNKEGEFMWAKMRYQTSSFMFHKKEQDALQAACPADSGKASPVNFYLYCEDVDGAYKKALEAGAESLKEPADMFWGDRMCQIKDKEGYTWCFARQIGEYDPTKAPAQWQ